MAAINAPGQRKDPLDTLVKGLGIASQIYGIRSDMANLDTHAKEQADADAKKARLDKNQYTQAEQVGLSKDFNLTQDKPATGQAFQIFDAKTNSPLWASYRKEVVNTPTKDIKTVIDGKPVVAIVNTNTGGIVSSYPDQPKDSKDKDANKDQYLAGSFGKRVEQANNIFDNLETQGYDRSSTGNSIRATILPGAVQNSQTKQQDQAERNFVNAVLRRESGSSINPSEFQSAELQYFPRAGDTAEVLDQKRQNRLQAFDSLKAEAGTAWDNIPSAPLVSTKKEKSSDGTAMAAPGVGPANPSAIDLLRVKAANGDKKAQAYIQSLGQ